MSNDAESARTMRECALCGNQEMGLMRCGKCKTTFYCNAAHQREDWAKHKKTCKSPEELFEEKLQSQKTSELRDRAEALVAPASWRALEASGDDGGVRRLDLSHLRPRDHLFLIRVYGKTMLDPDMEMFGCYDLIPHRSFTAFWAARHMTSEMMKLDQPERDARIRELINKYPSTTICFGMFFRESMDDRDPGWRERLGESI